MSPFLFSFRFGWLVLCKRGVWTGSLPCLFALLTRVLFRVVWGSRLVFICITGIQFVGYRSFLKYSDGLTLISSQEGYKLGHLIFSVMSSMSGWMLRFRGVVLCDGGLMERGKGKRLDLELWRKCDG